MANEYVPTTDVVRDAVTFPRRRLGEPRDMTDAAFDRRLTAHTRAACAIAWDKAVRAMRYADGTPVELIANVNPYREGDPT